MIDNIDYGIFKNKENVERAVYEYRIRNGWPTKAEIKDGTIILPPTAHVNLKSGEIK